MTARAVPEWVGEYLSIPFASGGRDRSGCDCYGLVRLVLSEHFATDIPAFVSGYRDALDRETTERLIADRAPLIRAARIESPKAGALVLMRFRGHSSHIGVCVSEAHVLHTDRETGVMCERLESPRLRGRKEGIYRVG